MLNVYKHDANHKLIEVDLNTAEKGSWINCYTPTEEELIQIHQLTGIPVHSLQTVLDREERSHVELEDDYIFVVVNTPVCVEMDSYDALPVIHFLPIKRHVFCSKFYHRHLLLSCIICKEFINRPVSLELEFVSRWKIKKFSICWNYKSH